jgi:hypothetical protein
VTDDVLASPLSGASREGGSARQSDINLDEIQLQVRQPCSRPRSLKGERGVFGWTCPECAEWGSVPCEIRHSSVVKWVPARFLMRALAHVERTPSDEATAPGEAKP